MKEVYWIGWAVSTVFWTVVGTVAELDRRRPVKAFVFAALVSSGISLFWFVVIPLGLLRWLSEEDK